MLAIVADKYLFSLDIPLDDAAEAILRLARGAMVQVDCAGYYESKRKVNPESTPCKVPT